MKNHVPRPTRGKIEILYEDEQLCVVCKGTALLSVPTGGERGAEKSALGLLEGIMRRRGTYSAAHRPFAVHRLDRDTSGVMLFALTESAQKRIMDLWHSMVSERLYRAVAENPHSPGRELPPSGLIDDALAFTAYNRGYVPGKDGAKAEPPRTVPARTHFTVVLRGKTHTLFELSLDTGKKNQIRAHLASKGYPLAGDKNYRARTDPFHRLCLHARTLCFTHPFTNQKLRFEVPEPAEWRNFVEKGEDSPARGKGTRPRTEGRTKEKAPATAQRRPSAREKAHSNFIELGKRRSR